MTASGIANLTGEPFEAGADVFTDYGPAKMPGYVAEALNAAEGAKRAAHAAEQKWRAELAARFNRGEPLA